MSSNAYRFFEQQNFLINKKFLLNQQNSHKIINVLRLSINNIINIFNNTNIEYTAKITRIENKNNIEIIVLTATEKNSESPLKIHLAQAIAKHDNMDFVMQKATELGIHQITPIITDRTIVKVNNSQSIKKIEHWQAIATNASCQSGRTMIPKINNIILLNNFIINSNHIHLKYKFILSPNNKTNNFSGFNLNSKQEIILIIGPEGGFSEQELNLAAQHDFININIGPRILRTETAALAAVSVLQAKFGDLDLKTS